MKDSGIKAECRTESHNCSFASIRKQGGVMADNFKLQEVCVVWAEVIRHKITLSYIYKKYESAEWTSGTSKKFTLLID